MLWGYQDKWMEEVFLDKFKGFLTFIIPYIGSFFLKSLKMNSQVEVSLAMNRLMYCNRPKNPLISFSLLGGSISNMALIFDGSISIPLSLTKKPNNFPMVTPNALLGVQPHSILLDPFIELSQVNDVTFL